MEPHRAMAEPMTPSVPGSAGPFPGPTLRQHPAGQQRRCQGPESACRSQQAEAVRPDVQIVVAKGTIALDHKAPSLVFAARFSPRPPSP